MTAGFFIANSSPGAATAATGIAGAHAGAGQGAVAGFEALLAAFFGGQGADLQTAKAALLSGKGGAPKAAGVEAAVKGANDNKDKDATSATNEADAKAGPKDAGKDEALSAEVQALAALMATPVSPAGGQTVAQAIASGALQTSGGEAKADAAAATAAFVTPALLGKGATAADAAAVAKAANAQAAEAQAEDAASNALDAGALAKTETDAQTQAPADAKDALAAKLAATAAQAAKASPTTRPAEAAPPAYAPPPQAQPAPQAKTTEPPPADAAPAPAADLAAADLAGVEAAAVEAAPPPAPAPAKPISHVAARQDAQRVANAATPQASAPVEPLIRTPVTPVGAIAARPAEAPDAAPSAPEAEVKLAKAEDAGPATPQPAAPQAAEHAQPAAATVAVRGSPETVASLAAQIVKKLEGRSTRFDVELHPADLGRVDVRLEIGAQGRVTAAMSFENPQAAAELRGRAHELQRALEQAGFDLSGGLSFDVAGDRGQGGQNLAGQQQQPDGGGLLRGRAFQAALQSNGDVAAAALPASFIAPGRTVSGVDIRI